MKNTRLISTILVAALIEVANFASAMPLMSVTSDEARSQIIASASALVGITEKTGHNDGVVIDHVLASVGLQGTGAPYCAAFNRFVYDCAGLHEFGPRSALAADWVRGATWTRANGGLQPLPGDTWGIYFASKRRVAHTGLVERWGSQVVLTIEGNTSSGAVINSEADRNGDGFWRKRRLVSQIYSVRNWLK